MRPAEFGCGLERRGVVGERRLDRVHALRRGGSARVVLIRLGHIPGGGEVVRERAGLLIRSLDPAILDRLPDLAMQLRAPCARELLVDRLPNQRVGEAVVPDRAGRLLDDVAAIACSRLSAISSGRYAGHSLEHVQLELASAHARDGQAARLAAVVESAQAADEEVLDALGNPRERLLEVVLERRRRATAPRRRTDCPACGRRSSARPRAGRCGPPGSRSAPRPPPRRALRAQASRAPARGAARRVPARERMRLIHLGLPVGAENQQRRTLGRRARHGATAAASARRPNGGRPGPGSARAPAATRAQQRSDRVEQHGTARARRTPRSSCRALSAGVGELGQRACASVARCGPSASRSSSSGVSET